MKNYIHRVSEELLQRMLQAFPVVGVTGPRQSGKSTLLQQCLPDYRYVTFDDGQMLDFFEEDPVGFMKVYSSKVIFDEVQKVPKLFDAVKLLVDQDRQWYGNFVMTTSNQFVFLNQISESLAGRIGLLSVLPFQYAEVPEPQRASSVYRGGYPELVTRDYAESDLWYSSYLETYLNKDVRNLAQVGNLRDFRRLIALLAANTSQVFDQTHYANQLGVSVSTIKRWVSILEASYIVFLLPPFYENYGKRLVKRPKVYFYDTGLVSYLTGIRNQELFEKGPLAGALFENYVISEILKQQRHEGNTSELFYFRTNHGVEVDLIIDHQTSKDWIEIKHSATFRPKMMQAVESLMEEGDQGLLLYQGEKFPYKEPLKVENVFEYLG